MKLHLVDGTFELFRAFFSSPSALNDERQEVGAARGLARNLNSLLRLSDVTHVAVAFDHVIESFRNDLFDGYKTGAGIEPVLYQQFGLAERVASALGMVVWPMTTFEADDALATAAARYGALPEVEEVVICSPDKDFAQCTVDAKVVLWDRIRDTRLDAKGVVEKFGVEPASIPDYLALVGDSADGIPGIPRWGAKSSSQVLARYKTIDDIPLSEADWDIKVRGANGLVGNLASEIENARLYRRLAVLRQDVPLKESLAELKYTGASRVELQTLCKELADDRLLQRVRISA